jgi:two-component system cell cycle response regulator DivK
MALACSAVVKTMEADQSAPLQYGRLTALAAAPRPRGYPLPPSGPSPSLFVLPRAKSKPAPRQRRARAVLIVDDSEAAREMYAEYLNYRGFWTITAPDGEAAVAIARSVRPSLVVMDLAMPGLDGIGAIRRLKQLPQTRRIPVILLTGHAVQAIEQGALEAGAAAFITKPCLPEDLEQHIQRLLAG